MSLKQFYITLFGLTCLLLTWNVFGLKAIPLFSSKQCILMIDPAGDAQETGRLIDGVYERSITLACAQALKHEIEEVLPMVTVLLTRISGEVVEPFQNAQFANRCEVDLFLRLQCFHDQAVQCHSLYFYHFSWGNELPLLVHNTMFIPYDKAHLMHTIVTKSYAEQLFKSLNKVSANICKGIFAIPCKPLRGITSPALCIEMGLTNKDSWRDYVKPIINALCELTSTI